MEDDISVYDINWEDLRVRRQELKDRSDMEGLSSDEADELIAINTAFSVMREDFESKKGTTEYEYHPGYLFFARCEQTQSNINTCLNFGQPMSVPESNQAPLIVVNPGWEKQIERSLQ